MSMNEISQALSYDFNRNIFSILGLPFDALNMHEVVESIYFAIDNNQPYFISTPNLNFLISSRKDNDFRQSIINSDLCLVDGMPLIWIAKLIGIPLHERVSGSDFIEVLMHSESRRGNPVKVFLFGGDEGVADQACKKLIQHPCGIQCVGSLNPGFGSIEEMSQARIIETINRSGAEFIIVSLGAKKGQAWIEHNRHKLDAPVISHLGAVVNFIAETVRRSPMIWQRVGFEWLWRIKEEPALWKRYFFDGLGFIKLLVTQILPYALIIFRKRKMSLERLPVTIRVSEKVGEIIISICGVAVEGNLQPVRDVFASLLPEQGNVCIDLEGVQYIDSSFVGLLLILYKYLGCDLSIKNDSALVRKIFYYNAVNFR